MSVRIAPSILSADLAHLMDEVERVLAGGADQIPVDVMDGHCVPNLTWGAPIVAALRRFTDAPLDCHLMVEHPEAYIAPFAEAGATFLTIHAEATAHLRTGSYRPSPFRELRHGGAVPAPGRRRPRGGGDQADALPHQS